MIFSVISHPRTGSKVLARKLAAKHKIPLFLGSLHKSPILNLSLSDQEIMNLKEGVLHGHWHTIDFRSERLIRFLQEKTKIVTVERKSIHAFASGVLIIDLLESSCLDKYRQVIESKASQVVDARSLSLSSVDRYFQIYLKTKKMKSIWAEFISELYQFEDVVGGHCSSESLYLKNKKIIKNWDEVSSYCLRHYPEIFSSDLI